MEDKLSIEPLDNVMVRVVMEYGQSFGARRVWGFSWFCGVVGLYDVRLRQEEDFTPVGTGRYVSFWIVQVLF